MFFFKGLLYSSLAAIMWGCIQVIYFKNLDYIPPLEIVTHRGIWAFFFFIVLITFKKKFINYFSIFKDKKKIIYLSISAILVSSNWLLFILSISINKVHDAAMGYFISPILSVGFGYLIFKENLSRIQIFALSLILFSILNLIINLGSIPWIALSLAITWSLYGVLRKKINVDSEVGLLFETSFLFPFLFIYLIFINNNGNSYFITDDIQSIIFLIGAGFVTAIPLFFFNIGIKMIPLGLAGIIFYLVPTLQFLTSIIYLGEEISKIKIISFLIIWTAVVMFLTESIKKNKL